MPIFIQLLLAWDTNECQTDLVLGVWVETEERAESSKRGCKNKICEAKKRELLLMLINSTISGIQVVSQIEAEMMGDQMKMRKRSCISFHP